MAGTPLSNLSQVGPHEGAELFDGVSVAGGAVVGGLFDVPAQAAALVEGAG